ECPFCQYFILDVPPDPGGGRPDEACRPGLSAVSGALAPETADKSPVLAARTGVLAVKGEANRKHATRHAQKSCYFGTLTSGVFWPTTMGVAGRAVTGDYSFHLGDRVTAESGRLGEGRAWAIAVALFGKNS